MRIKLVYLASSLFLCSIVGCTIVGTGVREVKYRAKEGVELFPAAKNLQKTPATRAALKRGACRFSKNSSASNAIVLRSNTFSKIAAKAKPAVVNIYVNTSTPVGVHVLGIPLPALPKVNLPGRALGSGFICSPEGFVLSNAHVVDQATELFAKTAKGKVLKLDIVAVDRQVDLSLLKIRAAGTYPYVELSNSDLLTEGDLVVAIGNPLGLNHSVSHGMISQKVIKQTERLDKPASENKSPVDFILSDTPLNPGNSGGPLLNISAQVVGVNTAIIRETQGISLSVPTNRVRTFLQEVGARPKS